MIPLLKEVLICLKAGRVTLPYPLKPMQAPPKFRGRPTIDGDKCIGCGACAIYRRPEAMLPAAASRPGTGSSSGGRRAACSIRDGTSGALPSGGSSPYDWLGRIPYSLIFCRSVGREIPRIWAVLVMFQSVY